MNELTLLDTLWRRRFRILLEAVLIAVLVYAASYLIPDSYTASTVILPPTYDSDITGMITGVPGAAALSRAMGMDSHSRREIYVGVLRSATINRKLVERFGLVERYRKKDAEKAGKELVTLTAITLTNEGFIRVAVTDHDRAVAASVANAYAEELDQFLRINTNTSARLRREFLEKRLLETRLALAAAEDTLRDYQVQRKLPALGADASRGDDAAATLMAEKVKREIELGTLESVSRGPNPRAESLRLELDQIDRELQKIPPAATGMARLYRDMRMQERVMLVLTEEYERSRVLELKNIPTVEVVDIATPPLHKSRPRRTLIALASLAIAAMVSATLLWARDRASRPAPA